ncbi:pantetheine-phosphate adenylyltransferase [Microlunatus sp. Gsoil 973]|uniref:pantetheine-phosphate adenylyltransferase n=1 Tax=Microlunatus sp. Gsoil 973 TaxID=2672569 RepID=UPI0012B4F1DE|nr:pantetheine-phosphate adenylyltransferase [Microlunatus sp. Gsoil 973]QGN32062.1 pantetheine-phosphate adenylyltransferase [Microlunatus sp. Gsoil 973]
MRRAACPGSYDPPTRGHLDVISRTAALFDQVHVLVGTNTAKTGLFTPQERVGLLEEALADLPGVEVHVFGGLVVDYCRTHDIDAVVKGIRGAVDLDYESQMARMNRAMTGLETLLLPAAPEWSAVSSSLVRDIARMGGSFEQFVTPGIAARTRVKLDAGS